MRRPPRWVIIATGASLTTLAILLLLPYVLNVDRYRGMIIAAIEESTGRRVTIGLMRARFFPSIGFTIDDVALSSPAGMGDHPFITADRVTGRLAWGPLLRRQFHVTSLTLVGPRVHLLEDDRHGTNYTFPAPAGGNSAWFQLADIDAMTIKDGSVSLGRVTGSPARLVPSLRVSHVNLSLRSIAINPARIMQSQLKLDLKGVVVDGPGLAPIELMSGEVALANGGVEATLAAVLGKAAAVRGTLQIETLESGVLRFGLKTPLLDLNHVATLTKPDLVAAPAPTLVPAPKSARAASPAKAAPIAEGRIAADWIRFGAFEGTNLTVETRIFADRIEMTPLAVDVYGGTLEGSARINTAATPPALSASMKLRRADLNKILAAATGDGRVSGTANLTLELSAALAGDVLQSLAGHGQATVADGRMPGFAADGLMGSLARIESAIMLGSADALQKEIPFRLLSGDFTIAARRVRSQRIHLDSVPGTVDLAGATGFDQVLDYKGSALLSARPQRGRDGAIALFRNVAGTVITGTIGRARIPFSLQGTLASPQVALKR